MPTDITEHPEAPDLEELGDFVVEPVPLDEIRRRHDEGLALIEDNLVERDDLDVRIPLYRAADGREKQQQDIGTYLYRFIQLFGSPQLPEYFAGEDISDRTNETFKFLLRVLTPEDADGALPDQWLMTVYDWKVGLGVGVAEWCEDGDPDVTAGSEQAYVSLRLAHNIGSEPVQCEFEGIWY